MRIFLVYLRVLARFLLDNKFPLYPFAISPNKVYLTHRAYIDKYIAALKEGLPQLVFKRAVFLGNRGIGTT